MKIKLFSFILIVLITFIPILTYSKSLKTVYFKRAEENKLGDFNYKQKISEKNLHGIPYYVVTYDYSKIISEKHFNNDGSLYYIAKYDYNEDGAYTKYEIHYNKELIIIKIRKPITRTDKTNKIEKNTYSTVKYINFQNNVRKLNKVLEFHTNGRVRLASYYDSNERLEKQESLDRKGKKIYVKHYGYFNNKRVLIKSENYDKKGVYQGYWEYSYSDTGKLIKKTFKN
ncbi:MAG: hypothetical protein OEV44_06865 [Spirochaetota bacterium]|nr:hypothetical protein [Spirochaetota bacterium]